MGLERYSQLSRLEKEQMVLDRLKQNKIWEMLNKDEKAFSNNYVADLRIAKKLENKKGVKNVD